jgi:hypothetical protein
MALAGAVAWPVVQGAGRAGFVFSGLLWAGLLVASLVPGLVMLLWRRGRRRWANGLRTVVLGALLLAVVACWGLGMANGERYLGARESLGSGDRYVAVIVCDGANLRQARDLFMKGVKDPSRYTDVASTMFPTISRTFMQNGAFTANGLSVWPSSSVPAHTAIVTGCYPRETGVMGQRQFNPATLHHNSYIGIGISALKSVMSAQVRTLYECFPRARSLVVLQIANRGASLYVPTTPEDEQVVKWTTQVVDATDALGRLAGQHELPRILVLTLPDIDHQTHNMPLNDRRATEVYLAQDKHVAAIFELYRRKGIFDKTLFVLCADHGMEQVRNHVTIDNLMDDLRFHVFQSLKWSVVPQWGSFEANLWVGRKTQFRHLYDAVALWGGNSDALLYVRGQEKDAAGHLVRDGWDIRPSDRNLHSYSVGGDTVDIIQRLLEYSPGIGLVMTNPSRHIFRVYGRAGQGQIEEREAGGAPQFRYRVTRGGDPLRYAADPRLRAMMARGEWFGDAQWAEATYLQHYPDALRRIAYSFENPNSGDMHVVATDGWDFAPYYVTWQVLSGSHGSLNQEASLVPIMFYGPGVRRVELPYARTVDILPTILAYLNAGTPGRISGRALPIFTDAAKERAVGQAAGGGFRDAAVSDGRYDYWLEHSYASYDRRLMRRSRAGGKPEVLVQSVREACSALRAGPNLTLEMRGGTDGRLLMRVVYAGETKRGPVVAYDVGRRRFTGQ